MEWFYHCIDPMNRLSEGMRHQTSHFSVSQEDVLCCVVLCCQPVVIAVFAVNQDKLVKDFMWLLRNTEQHTVVGKILWLGVSLLKPHKAGCMPLFGDVFLPSGTADGRTQQIDTEDDLTSSLSFLTIYHVLWKTSLCRFWLFSHISCLRETPLGISPGCLECAASSLLSTHDVV